MGVQLSLTDQGPQVAFAPFRPPRERRVELPVVDDIQPPGDITQLHLAELANSSFLHRVVWMRNDEVLKLLGE